MNKTEIVRVIGRRVWDSRGRPTVEAEVHLSGGAMGRAIAPAGASTGSGEAVDLRDGGAAFGGYDVTRAIGSVSGEISENLVGMDARDQAAIDIALVALDGSGDKSRLGANATVAVSMAVAHSVAAANGIPLWRHLLVDQKPRIPVPEIQILGGGAHAGRRVDIQDFMVIAVGAADYVQALDWTAEVYRAAGEIMSEEGRLQGVADEGGFWPAFGSNEDGLEILVRAIERAGLRPGEDMAISLDIAASEFGQAGRYRLGLEERELDSDGLVEMLIDWVERYPIVAVEDPV
ncbi:MAG: phosphopyruvate hydratase, partial [Proteobacteria bacterium]|nr:phosphopyruvate hydratase [Pseudomonadota bacterium]